jgi:energy-coupling factor transporter ATP-binding protein EcfA2
LRLPYLTTSECHNRVHEICRLLDLNASLFIHELEDGQLFLLSLATELVTNPPLICIESPIDTLDEYSSVLIVQTLAKIAHRFNTSTTIVFTAQSPSSTIFSSLDQVVVFFDKKILYSSKTFFEKDHLGRAQQVLSSALQTPPRGTTGVPGAGLLAPHPTFEYCFQTLELISREIKRCGYGTKLFYLTPDLLRIVAKDVDLLHFLVADPQQSTLLLERYVDRFHGREMREKKQKLEAILQRYVQFIVLKTIEFQSQQRKTDRVMSGEQGEDADAPLEDRFLLDFSLPSPALVRPAC